MNKNYLALNNNKKTGKLQNFKNTKLRQINKFVVIKNKITVNMSSVAKKLLKLFI